MVRSSNIASGKALSLLIALLDDYLNFDLGSLPFHAGFADANNASLYILFVRRQSI